MGKKVTIIGAGSVGSTIAYTMAVNGIATEIVMIDINEAKALGEALDIRQGAPFCRAGFDLCRQLSGRAGLRHRGHSDLRYCA